MEHNEKTRVMSSLKRGRPTLVEQAQREAIGLPVPLKGDVPLLQCTRCGGTFMPRVHRTMADGMRVMRCDKCGYTHQIPLDLLKRLI